MGRWVGVGDVGEDVGDGVGYSKSFLYLIKSIKTLFAKTLVPKQANAYTLSEAANIKGTNITQAKGKVDPPAVWPHLK